jgi:hypothetical protein
MSTAELKVKLIKEITDSDNEELLKDVFRLIELEKDDPLVYKLSEEQLSAVNEAQEQIKAGKFLADDEANKEIDEWLEK